MNGAWLLPTFPWVARVVAFTFYRIRYGGERVPSHGPVLLIANHPNSLLDPTLVSAAARRPVRFLAKAPLFTQRSLGWLMRAVGAIPVYRRSDDPTQIDRNVEMFRAVHAALADGGAVGIFPEGRSHSEPALVPLRTGAARIAFGAHSLTRRTFPIVPVGLVFRQKDKFRSEALALTGSPVPWDDLAPRGLEDDDAVRALTTRLDEALRHLTINLEHWQDQPLVECAVRIWETERAAPPGPEERLARLRATTRVLAAVRASEEPGATDLARAVEAHRHRLERLGLRPADLVADVGLARGVGWALRRMPLIMFAPALAIPGWLLFWVPYRLTGFVTNRLRPPVDQLSTYKLIGGILFYIGWVLALFVVGTVMFNAWVGLGLLIAIPAVGMAGLVIRERWRGAGSDVRRFFLLRSHQALIDDLRVAQNDLGVRLDRLYHEFAAEGAA